MHFELNTMHESKDSIWTNKLHLYNKWVHDNLNSLFKILNLKS